MSVWTRRVVDRFKQLFADPARYSYGVIADILSDEFRVRITRNAAIGFGKRIDMPKRVRTDTPRKREVRLEHRGKPDKDPSAPRPPIAPAPYVPKPEVGKGTLRIEQLKPRSCRWPFGDRPPFLYCGCKTVEGHPYCEDHMRIGHVRWQPPTAA